jgi:hypothetical protein
MADKKSFDFIIYLFLVKIYLINPLQKQKYFLERVAKLEKIF